MFRYIYCIVLCVYSYTCRVVSYIVHISITNVLVRVSGLRTRFPGLGALLHLASKTPPLPCFGHLDARKHRTCRALATWALEGAATWPRKHRPCHALAIWTPENTAPAVLWPLGRSKGLLEAPLGVPGAFVWAARAPTWCPKTM